MDMLKHYLCAALLLIQFGLDLSAVSESSCPALAGVPGIPGHNGSPGRDGRDGVPGPKGEKGDPGVCAQGPPGKMGPASPTDFKGERGNTGLPGSPADDGLITNLQSDMRELINRITVTETALDAGDKIMKNLQSEVKHLTDRLNGIEKASRFRIFRNVGLKYYVSNGLEANFDEGLKFCTDVGGEIVLPTTEEENKLLMSLHPVLGSSYIMIGTTDIQKEGTFVDIDNQTLSFTKWMINEPNDYKGAEDCAAIYTDGEWNDVRCSSKWHVVCELQSR